MATPAVLCRHGCRCTSGWVPARMRLRLQSVDGGGGGGQAAAYATGGGAAGEEEAAATTATKPAEEAPGAMSRRLEQATEDALLTGGRGGRRAVLDEAGFSEALKERLLQKIAAAPAPSLSSSASSSSSAALSSSLLSSPPSSSASLHPDAPWTGEEAPAAAVLRMLQDAHKPLAPALRAKTRTPPVVVDMRPRRAADAARSPGQRLSAARDKATAYGIEKMVAGQRAPTPESGSNAAEREERQRLLRERFGPAARRGGAMPTTMTGLAALANERIEAAIAGGQFRDVARGPGVAQTRDPRVDSPFVDTTEYLMNRVLQRQELVPPWIEKQQDLARAAQRFRAQLRTAWRRHAARTVASRGGPLADQLAAARRYARAEAVHNPRPRDVEALVVPVAAAAAADAMAHKVEIKAGPDTGPDAGTPGTDADTDPDTDPIPDDPPGPPLRDPAWEAAERDYLERAVAELNALARSYNLMAPALAKKPYFSLDRELRACYADVAPTLAAAIRDRAAPPSGRNLADRAGDGARPRRRLARLVGDAPPPVRVRDSTAPHYGLRAMWRDLWR